MGSGHVVQATGGPGTGAGPVGVGAHLPWEGTDAHSRIHPTFVPASRRESSWHDDQEATMRPSSQNLYRSGKTVLEPDSIESELEARDQPGTDGETGPVPEANRPGHHPDEEQDQPDLDDFAEKFGAVPPAADGDDDDRNGDSTAKALGVAADSTLKALFTTLRLASRAPMHPVVWMRRVIGG